MLILALGHGSGSLEPDMTCVRPDGPALLSPTHVLRPEKGRVPADPYWHLPTRPTFGRCHDGAAKALQASATSARSAEVFASGIPLVVDEVCILP